MQKFFVVAVKDRAAEVYLRPAFFPTEALALRSFVQEVNNPSDENAMYKNPTDFELYCLGVYEDESGLLSPEVGVTGPRPRLMARAEEVKKPSIKE